VAVDESQLWCHAPSADVPLSFGAADIATTGLRETSIPKRHIAMLKRVAILIPTPAMLAGTAPATARLSLPRRLQTNTHPAIHPMPHLCLMPPAPSLLCLRVFGTIDGPAS